MKWRKKKQRIENKNLNSKKQEAEPKLKYVNKDKTLTRNFIYKYIPIQTYKDVKKLEEVETCPICLDEFNDQDQVRQTYCGHIFHPKCLVDWVDRNEVCPLCKAKLTYMFIKKRWEDNQDKLQEIREIEINRLDIQLSSEYSNSEIEDYSIQWSEKDDSLCEEKEEEKRIIKSEKDDNFENEAQQEEIMTSQKDDNFEYEQKEDPNEESSDLQ